MSSPIRILLVEDSPDDAELVERTLRDAGLNVYIKRVETSHQLEESLCAEVWDLIVSDYHLPGFSAHDTLWAIRESGLDLPCIIVSGAIGEMAAVDLLKAGAADFVPKNDLSRLGPAIERELREGWARAQGRKAEVALRESRARYQDLFEHSPVPIWIEDLSGIKKKFDALRKSGVSNFRDYFNQHSDAVKQCAQELRIVDVNHASLNFFSVNTKEELPRNRSRYFREESWPFFKEEIIQLAEGVTRFNHEVPMCGLSGEAKIVSLHLSVSPGFEGDLSRVLISCMDITERIQNERRKTIIGNLLRLAVEPLSQLELIRYLTEKLAQWTGCEAVGIRLKKGEDYPYAETRGFTAEFLELENTLCAQDAKGDVIRDTKGRPIIECMCGNVICGRTDPSKPFFTPKGSFFSNCTTILLASLTKEDRQALARNRCNGAGYESMALIPLRDSQGCFGLLQFNDKRMNRFEITPIHVLEEIGDIVAAVLSKKQTDSAIHESEERFRRLTSLAPVGVFLADAAGKYLYVNEWWLDLTGLRLEEALGDGWKRALHRQDKEKITQQWDYMVESKGSWNVEYRFQRADGLTPWILGAATALRDETGQVTGYLGANVDISERKQMEESLRNMEQLSARGQMAAYIAHEINNPLAGIKNAFRLLEDVIPADHPRKNYVELIRRETDRISNIVRTMYSLYRPYPKETKSVHLKDVFQDLNSLLEPKLRSQDVEIRTKTVPPDLAAELPEGLIRQVLFNLIQNAVEASPPGSIVEVEGMMEGRCLLLTIADQGSGIAPQDTEQVFRAGFTTKVDTEMSGLGLGLSTCKNLVESMNGTLDFFPNPVGRGTIFRVRLEIAQVTSGD